MSETLYSASQVNKFVECERLWGWEYLEGIKPPTKPAAAFGKRVHTVQERWLRNSIPPDPKTPEGKVALVGLKFLPQPSPLLEIERGFVFRFRGYRYRGFVDVGLNTAHGPWVIDHKTTGDLMWALSEEDLLHDIQAILYALECMLRYGVDEVNLMWLYYRTRGKAIAEPRRATISRTEILSGMEVIEPYVEQMEGHRRAKTPVLKLVPNAAACGNYGGCPFEDRCKLTAKQRRKSIMAKVGKKKSLSEKMKDRKKGKKDTKADEGKEKSLKPTSPAPEVNAPEKPSDEEAQSPLPEEKPKEKTEEKPKSDADKRGRGRPKGAKNKDAATSSATTEAVLLDHRDYFMQLFVPACAAGNFDSADRAWYVYKNEFMKE